MDSGSLRAITRSRMTIDLPSVFTSDSGSLRAIARSRMTMTLRVRRFLAGPGVRSGLGVDRRARRSFGLGALTEPGGKHQITNHAVKPRITSHESRTAPALYRDGIPLRIERPRYATPPAVAGDTQPSGQARPRSTAELPPGSVPLRTRSVYGSDSRAAG
jgi:hypothetical protein